MFKLLVLFYYLCCFTFAGHSLWRKKKNGLMIAILITSLPVLGIFLALYLFKSAKPCVRGQEDAGDSAAYFGKAGMEEEYLNLKQPIDIEKEINLVPIQEALLLNDNKIKRTLLIHSLKENVVHNPQVLEMALENEDSETSHYAATAIMELKRKLLNRIQELEEQLAAKPDDPGTLSTYAEVIQQYLKSGFLDEGTCTQYQTLLSKVLERILESGNGSQQHYIEKINVDLEFHDYKKASLYSEKFLESHRDDEMAYIMAMKLHYTLRNPSRLQSVVSLLRKQPVRLTPQGLNIIRFWL